MSEAYCGLLVIQGLQVLFLDLGPKDQAHKRTLSIKEYATCKTLYFGGGRNMVPKTTHGDAEEAHGAKCRFFACETRLWHPVPLKRGQQMIGVIRYW